MASSSFSRITAYQILPTTQKWKMTAWNKWKYSMQIVNRNVCSALLWYQNERNWNHLFHRVSENYFKIILYSRFPITHDIGRISGCIYSKDISTNIYLKIFTYRVLIRCEFAHWSIDKLWQIQKEIYVGYLSHDIIERLHMGYTYCCIIQEITRDNSLCLKIIRTSNLKPIQHIVVKIWIDKELTQINHLNGWSYCVNQEEFQLFCW